MNTATRESLGRFFLLRNAVVCQQTAARRDRYSGGLYLIRNSSWPEKYLTFVRLTGRSLR